MGMKMTIRWSLVFVMVLTTAAGCGDDGEPAGAIEEVFTASFSVRESIEQLHITHAVPGTTLGLYTTAGDLIHEGVVDDLGSLIFRLVPPKGRYYIETVDAVDPEKSGPHRVMSVEGSVPPQAFYSSQVLEPGFNYIETRDGTLLSAYVSLPGPPENGPYPTVVNYSGYDPSQPGEPLDLGDVDIEFLCIFFPILCDMPNHPSGMIAGLLGYASVGVNMRGTGCSGGAYDFFEPAQLTDGYDVIETVAAQPWVAHGKVGMAGISYPGISQLFVASTRPPSLAAITPLSVIADSARSVIAPGGIFNYGFGLAWVERVLDGADPYGKGWEQALVDAGDTVCEENQLLHGQKVDLIAKALENEFYDPVILDPLAPVTFVDTIDIPVFLSGAWQDEQTGPHFATMLDKFTGPGVKRFTLFNGVHPDGYAPQVLTEWVTFLDFYVARKIPRIGNVMVLLAPVLMEFQLGARMPLAQTRFAGYRDFDRALADYEAEQAVRVIFENGAAEEVDPGAPMGAFEHHFDGWPVEGTRPWRLYFQPDGTLGESPPTVSGSASTFRHDPEEGDRATVTDGSIWDSQPNYEYAPLPEDRAVAFIGEPLDQDTVMIGTGSVDLWIRSTATEADLEVNLTDVRPDGQEGYVQSGWLRAGHRHLSDRSTELLPVHTHLETDADPLTPGEWTEARILLMPFAHVFRAGSRIRISVDTPGASRAEWKFILADLDDQVRHSVAHSSERPSSLVLPIVSGVDVPTERPACNALRGQPCRDYVPFDNTPE
jgi:predicted acyl esterase